jgi:hypothetical protein
VGIPEVKRLLGRARRIWKNNIKMDFQELVFECMYWIELAQDRYRRRTTANAVMNFGLHELRAIS